MIPENRRFNYCFKYCDRRNCNTGRKTKHEEDGQTNVDCTSTAGSTAERSLVPLKSSHEKDIYPSRIALVDFKVVGSIPVSLNRTENEMIWSINKNIFSKNIIRTLPSPTGVRNSVKYTKTTLIKEKKQGKGTGTTNSGPIRIPVRGATTSSTSTKTVPSNRLFSDHYWTQLTSLLNERLKRVENKMDVILPKVSLKSQVEKLQNKCLKYERDISTLRSLATLQQRSLDRICSLFGVIGVAMTMEDLKSPTSHKSDESSSSQRNPRSVKFNLNRSKKREKQKVKSRNGSKLGCRPRWR